jgi:hypothetical protein
MVNKRIPDEVREQVKRMREEHPGYTQLELAQRNGISASMVRKILGQGVYKEGARRTPGMGERQVTPPSSTDLLTLVKTLKNDVMVLYSELEALEQEVVLINTVSDLSSRLSSMADKAALAEREAARPRAQSIQRAMVQHSYPFD